MQVQVTSWGWTFGGGSGGALRLSVVPSCFTICDHIRLLTHTSQLILAALADPYHVCMRLHSVSCISNRINPSLAAIRFMLYPCAGCKHGSSVSGELVFNLPGNR